MSYAGGRKELPYGFTIEQFLALSHAPRRLEELAEAIQLYTPAAREHVNQARQTADWIRQQFPEIDRYWDCLVASEEQALEDAARRELEREERQRETEPC